MFTTTTLVVAGDGILGGMVVVGGKSHFPRSTEGSLYIDLIDAKTNELVWQGIGSSQLYTGSDIDRRDEKIREIVSEILAEYPPGVMDKK